MEKLEIILGDITLLETDAIVNAANRLFWAVAVWTAAFIVPPDRGCLQSVVRCRAARQAAQKSQRDTTCPANM